MKVLSVNVSQLRPIQLGASEVMTGIFKEPRPGRLRVNRLKIEGDAQGDLRVHGGEYKAVYAYPIEHYSYWQEILGRRNLAPGSFGENLTTEGLTEWNACIGDILQIGTARLQITHPRMPCSKLAAKFNRPELIKEFLWSGRSGFYFRVIEEGELGAGDAIETTDRDANEVSVRQLLGLTDLREGDLDLAHRAARLESLPPSWRDDVRERIKELSSEQIHEE